FIVNLIFGQLPATIGPSHPFSSVSDVPRLALGAGSALRGPGPDRRAGVDLAAGLIVAVIELGLAWGGFADRGEGAGRSAEQPEQQHAEDAQCAGAGIHGVPLGDPGA